MLARALSCAVVGLDSALVEVEVDLSQGLPAFTKVCRSKDGVNAPRARPASGLPLCSASPALVPGNR
jgi:magnesium chelatase family protein